MDTKITARMLYNLKASVCNKCVWKINKFTVWKHMLCLCCPIRECTLSLSKHVLISPAFRTACADRTTREFIDCWYFCYRNMSEKKSQRHRHRFGFSFIRAELSFTVRSHHIYNSHTKRSTYKVNSKIENWLFFVVITFRFQEQDCANLIEYFQKLSRQRSLMFFLKLHPKMNSKNKNDFTDV